MTTPRLTRRQWGAKPVDPNRPTRVASTKGTALHWVGPRVWGTRGPAGRHSECAGKVQGIQRTHMAGEYYDIAYSEIACPHGYRFEGRGYHVQVGANGSSAGNRSHYAILALVGEGDPITSELVEAIDDAFEDYRRNAHAGTDTTTHRIILRANTGRTTECPGDKLAALEGAGRFMHREPAPTPIPKPPVPTTPTAARMETPTMLFYKITGHADPRVNSPVVMTDGFVMRWIPNPTAWARIKASVKDQIGKEPTAIAVKDLNYLALEWHGPKPFDGYPIPNRAVVKTTS
jgi:hypothetical protein